MERVPPQVSIGCPREEQIAVERVRSISDSEPTNPRLGFMVAALFVAALGIRAVFIWKDRLWLDEVWSATFAVQSPFDVIIATLRFDPHPPFYYLQLWLWATISHSTFWLFANSLFWSWLAVLSLYYVTRQLISQRL